MDVHEYLMQTDYGPRYADGVLYWKVKNRILYVFTVGKWRGQTRVGKQQDPERFKRIKNEILDNLQCCGGLIPGLEPEDHIFTGDELVLPESPWRENPEFRPNIHFEDVGTRTSGFGEAPIVLDMAEMSYIGTVVAGIIAVKLKYEVSEDYPGLSESLGNVTGLMSNITGPLMTYISRTSLDMEEIFERAQQRGETAWAYLVRFLIRPHHDNNRRIFHTIDVIQDRMTAVVNSLAILTGDDMESGQIEWEGEDEYYSFLNAFNSAGAAVELLSTWIDQSTNSFTPETGRII